MARQFKSQIFLFLATTWTCLYLGIITEVQSQVENDILERCLGHETCSACIDAAPACAWCKQKGFIGTRCGPPNVLTEAGCDPEQIYERGFSESFAVQDEEFSDHDVKAHAFQVRPQKARLAIRAGGSGVNMTMRFRSALNFPLDVYYLMDLTWSMRDDKVTLAALGDDLTRTLANLTANFRLGFGSYVDKPEMPFIDRARLENPCRSEQQICSPAYGFKNHMSLSQNINNFVDRVNEAQVSGNIDNAEGGLDALMQAVVCTEHIGWAEASRKVVLMATDGILHFAGDGKLGGAVRRNDGLCHLDPNTGLYLSSTELDYPSLAEMDRALLENRVSVIMAVTSNRLRHFEQLSEVLRSRSKVAVLEEDSSNIVELMRQSYQELVSNVSFSSNSSSSLKISYWSTCAGRETMREGESCSGVKEAEELEFMLFFSLDTCPSDPKLWKQKVLVSEAGVGASLEVDTELLCGCECEASAEVNSTSCKGHGDLECGVCRCHQGWYGRTCGCTGQNATTVPELEAGCRPPGSSSLRLNELCNDRGDCVCGKCECHEHAHGEFCECDDTKCDRWGIDGALCGGEGRGKCACGRCQCETGWGGHDCACSQNTKTCLAPGDTKLCSGQGRCDCGQCICGADSTGARFTGRFCEKCATCGGLCELYRPCVLCKAFNSGCPKNLDIDPCHTNTSDAYLDIVSGKLYVSEEAGEEICMFTDPEDDCIFKFSYRIDYTREVRLRVALTKTCSPPVNVAMYAGVVALLVVLAGIFLLLLWRCGVAAKDRLEYKRFQKENERALQAAEANPLYKPATTHYVVPRGFMELEEPSSPSSPALAGSPILKSPPPTSPR